MRRDFSKVNEVDLTFGGTIPAEHVLLWNDLAEEITDEFNLVVSVAGEQEQQNLDWWVTSVASRNTCTSPLFHHCLSIAYLHELSKAKLLPSVVHCNSNSTLRWIQARYPSIKVIYSPKHQRLAFLKKIKECLGGVIHLVAQYTFSKIYHLDGHVTNKLPSKVRLIDTFVAPGLMGEERYYPSLLEEVEEREKDDIFWVPFLFNHKPMSYGQVFSELSQSEGKYLQVHSLLCFEDYCFALSHFGRRKALKVQNAKFQGVDMKPWIMEELSTCSGMKTSMMSLLFLPFFRRLKKNGIEVVVAINWFENQTVDKAWNYSVNKVFNHVKSKGYQGFYPLSMDHNLYPTINEVEQSVVPKEIWVIGQALIKDAKRFTDKIDVKVGPALRFGQPKNSKLLKRTSGSQRVLVALPNIQSLVQEIMDNVIYLKKCIGEDNEVEWIIKPHPLTPDKVLSRYKIKLSDCKWSRSDFLCELVKSHLVISGRSDTCMTTILHLKPLIVVGSTSGLNHIPIPKSLDKDRWFLSNHRDEMVNFFTDFIEGRFDLDKFSEDENRKLISDYYTPLTKPVVDKFLN